MSDAQLALFLQLILSQLVNGIYNLEQNLPEDMKVKTGGTNVYFDPLRMNYPVMDELYKLRNDILSGIDQLNAGVDKKPKHMI